MIKGVLPLLSRQCILISLAFSACIANSSAAVTDALVAYWPLEEISADSTTPDLVFTNTMTVIGAPAVTPGQAGNAFTFDGSTTYLLNAHDSDNGPTGLPIYRGGQYTITMWVKGAAQTAKYLYCEASTNSTAPLVILQTGNAAANNAKLDVILRPDSGAALLNHVVSSQVVFDDTWHHIAWTDDHGSVRL
jgi:hypothetical protein